MNSSFYFVQNKVQGTLRGGIIINETLSNFNTIAKEIASVHMGTNLNILGMLVIIMSFLYLILNKNLKNTPKKNKLRSTSILPLNRKLSEGEDKDFVLKLNIDYKDQPYKRRSLSSPPLSSVASKESFDMVDVV